MATDIRGLSSKRRRGIEPRDAVEALLAAQMAVIRVEELKAVRGLANTEMPVQHDTALNAVTRTQTCD
jgi:hypothetical protein